MTPINLELQLEALLFFKAEPTNLKSLAKLLNEDEKVISEKLDTLGQNLIGRGIRLIQNGDEVSLATAPETSSLIESVKKQELSRDIGKAGYETLAIILYRGPISRSGIDYIRGVNSSFILRNLRIRGLVDRKENRSGTRSYLYTPSTELYAYLGITNKEDLPDFVKVQEDIKIFMEQDEEGVEEGHKNIN